MTKDTAIALFTQLEKATFPFENFDAPESAWADENTPPTVPLPTYAVRLDARIDNSEERDFRLRVTIGNLAPSIEALRELTGQAEEAGVTIRVENNGVELK